MIPQIIDKEGVLVVRAELVGDIERVINQEREWRIQVATVC